MVTDEELGAQLGARLTEELSDLTAPPGLAGTVRRRRTRQRLALGGALGVPVVAAGLALALAAGQPAARHAPAAGTTAATPQVRTVGYVAARSQQALGTVDQYVMHETVTLAGRPVSQKWTDGAKVRSVTIWEPVANPPNAVLFTADGSQVTTLGVNYRTHTWYQWSVKGSPRPFDIEYENPDQLRRLLADGTVTLVGDDQVDGRAAVHLRLSMPGGQLDIELWVDADSYLPLRVTDRAGIVTFAIRYEWLPRTPQALAHIELTVPAGFRQDPPAPGGRSADATPTPK